MTPTHCAGVRASRYPLQFKKRPILEPVGQVGPRGGTMGPWAESLCKRVAQLTLPFAQNKAFDFAGGPFTLVGSLFGHLSEVAGLS